MLDDTDGIHNICMVSPWKRCKGWM